MSNPKNIPPAFWIIEQVKEVIKQRLTSGNKRMDLLQLMLDVATRDEIKVRKMTFLLKLFLFIVFLG